MLRVSSLFLCVPLFALVALALFFVVWLASLCCWEARVLPAQPFLASAKRFVMFIIGRNALASYSTDDIETAEDVSSKNNTQLKTSYKRMN